MADELKVTVGCSYRNGRLREEFGVPLKLQNVPRLAEDNSKYLENLYTASGIDQATAGFDAGVMTASTGVTQIDTYNNAKVTTNGWLFMENIEPVPSGDYIQWGPTVTFAADSAITMSDSAGKTAFHFVAQENKNFSNGDSVLVPFGRLEAGESAAMRVTPSGMTIAIQAGSGLSTLANDVSPSAKLRYILFED